MHRPILGRRLLACAVLAASLAMTGLPGSTAALAPAAAQVQATPAPAGGQGGGTSLEQAAENAGDTGRKVAISLLGLAFAVAAVILVFTRDFRAAAAVFGVGLLGVLLATPAALNVLNDLVTHWFGGR